MSLLSQRNDPMYGIFAALKDLDGKYESRYKIIGTNGVTEYNSFYRYYEVDSSSYFSYQNEIEIFFKFPIKITNYSFVLSYGHSYSHTWEMYGIDKNGEHLVDKQTNLDLCSGAQHCYDNTLATKTIK